MDATSVALADAAQRVLDGAEKKERSFEEWYEVGWYEMGLLRDALSAFARAHPEPDGNVAVR